MGTNEYARAVVVVTPSMPPTIPPLELFPFLLAFLNYNFIDASFPPGSFMILFIPLPYNLGL